MKFSRLSAKERNRKDQGFFAPKAKGKAGKYGGKGKNFMKENLNEVVKKKKKTLFALLEITNYKYLLFA